MGTQFQWDRNHLQVPASYSTMASGCVHHTNLAKKKCNLVRLSPLQTQFKQVTLKLKFNYYCCYSVLRCATHRPVVVPSYQTATTANGRKPLDNEGRRCVLLISTSVIYLADLPVRTPQKNSFPVGVVVSSTPSFCAW